METAILIWEDIVKDKEGFPISDPHETETYAEEKSATRTEVYEALRTGVDVKTILEIRQEDWEATRHIVDGKPEYARKIKFDGCTYDIIRAYRKGKATVELTCG